MDVILLPLPTLAYSYWSISSIVPYSLAEVASPLNGLDGAPFFN